MSLTNALKRLERDGKLTPAGSPETADSVAPAHPEVRSEQQVMELIDRAEASLDAALAPEFPCDQRESEQFATPAASAAPQHDRDQRAWEDLDDADDDEPIDYTDGLASPPPTASRVSETSSAPPPPAEPPGGAARQELMDAETGVLSTWAELARLVQEAGAYDPPNPLGGSFAASDYRPVILPLDDLFFAEEDTAPSTIAEDSLGNRGVAAQEALDEPVTSQTVLFPAKNDLRSAPPSDTQHENTAQRAIEIDDDEHDILSLQRLDELERLAREYAEPSGVEDRPSRPSQPLASAADSLVIEADMEAIFRSLGVSAPSTVRLDDELDEVLSHGRPRAGNATDRVDDAAVGAPAEASVEPVDAEAVVLKMPSPVSSEAALDRIFYDSTLHEEVAVPLQPAVVITDFERRIASSLQRPDVQAEMERIVDRLRGRMRGDLPETMGCVAPRSTGRTADVLAQMALWLGPMEEDVLVVDANLADQSLTRGLRALDEPGLCEVLSHKKTAWEAIRPTAHPHLWLVPTGDDVLGLSRIPHQTDLNQLRELLQFWKTYFHRVFIDLGTVQSTLVEPFARTLDATLLVVPGTQVAPGANAVLRDAKDAADRMRSYGNPPAGCIVTDVPGGMSASA